MSNILQRLFRSNPLNNPANFNPMGINAFLEMMGGQNKTDSGEVVNAHTAMQTATVWACVNLISRQMGVNKLQMFKIDPDGNKTLAFDHDYYDIVASRPNPEQDAISFRVAVMISVLLHGNGYIEIQRDKGNRVVALWKRDATKTRPCRLQDGSKVYETTDGGEGRIRFIQDDDMMHIMGPTLDGYTGLSPIMFAKTYIGGEIAMDKYGARYFANNSIPPIALVTKQIIKAEDKIKMRADWEALHSKHNQHRVSILDGEMDVKQMAIPNDAAQFLQSKEATAKQIASMFNVPGYCIGLLDKGIKANVEQQAQDLYTFCLRPWMTTWEMVFTNKLFNRQGRSAGRYVVKFDTRELLIKDSATKMAYYQTAVQNGWLSQDEVRDLEGFNAIPDGDGDGYYIQLNMQSLALANSTDPQPDGPDLELSQETEANSLPRRVGQTYRGLFADGVNRIAKSSSRDYKTVYRCLWPTVDAMSQSALVGLSVDETTESDKAIEKYLQGLQHRASKWTAESDLKAICAEEIKRVERALVFAAHADEAETKSKRLLAKLQVDDAQQENEDD